MLAGVRLRAEQEADYGSVAELLSMGYADPVTAEQVREWRRNVAPGRVADRIVAVNGTEQRVVGYGHALRDSWMAPGLFWLHVAVDATERRQGIGQALYDAVLGFAREHGATFLRAEARDTLPEGWDFAKRQGFEIERHIFESALDLEAFDEAPFVASVTGAEARGIRFFSLADLGDSEDARRRLHALNEDIAVDVPGSDRTRRPFDAFAQDIFAAHWFRPDTQIVAADGERWVGLAAVGIFLETRSAFNMFTGVAQEWRGRGIAQALKLLAIRSAIRYGALSIRTNNDSENAPMLAINRAFGYRPEPGYYRLRCDHM